MSADLASSSPTLHGPRSTAMHKRAIAERLPVCGGIELTHRCNLACVHCYVNLAANDREAQRRELTTDEWYRVIDQIVDAGTLWLTITGGEPLLRPDFCDIYRYAHGKGLVLVVYTNATLITERHLELWRHHPPRHIEITQYGYTRETYDKVTDAGANYDRFTRGMARARAAGLHVTLKTMAMRDTVHEVAAIADYARREGLQFRFDAVISPRIDGGRKPLAQRLSPAEVAAIEGVDEKRRRQFADVCTSITSMKGQTPADDKLYQCGAGVATFTIDPYGKLHVCELSRKPGWDVLRDGLMAGFTVGFNQVLNQRRSDMSGCGSCGAGGGCSNCAGMAELEGRSVDEGDAAYLCQVTDARNTLLFGDARPMPNGLVKLRLRGEHGQQIP
jgi:MoaA/NifB/PqqE/SkfB family radical SAM enzyme